ncbi:MAG: hypothetical protein ACK41W_04985 [Cyanobacteriota bacterium]
MARVQLFLSTVSDEFRSYRDRLRHLLTRPDVEVKVQEDFIVTGDETLEMLDTYIKRCDGVIHLVGDMTGAMAKPQSVAAIASRYPELGSRLPLAEFLQADGPSLSYTQWEAWLALWHGKRLFIATPQPGSQRDGDYRIAQEQQAIQQAHLARLRGIGRYPGCKFASQGELVAEVSVSFVLDLLVKAGLNPNPYTPHNLPDRATRAERFVGREAELQRLAELLSPEGSRVYLTGMGGVGKSELALQHAYDNLDRYRGGIVRLDARQGLAAMASQLVTFFRAAFPKVALPDDMSPTELLPVCWSQWPAGSDSPEPVLLILDDQRGENLPDDSVDIRGYAAERQLFAGLPHRFRRLISQREPAPTGTRAIELPLLQREASLKLLTLQAGEGGPSRIEAEVQAADALCAEVGDLPLVLVLLGARLAERPDMKLSQLLADLKAKGAEAKALQQAHPELGAQRGVVEALLISWEPLSEAAKSLGTLLGVMAPAVIPWELVEACRLPEQEVEEGSAFGEQQSELRRAQLLERVGEGMYRLHPLVRQFIRLQSRDQVSVATAWRGQLAMAVMDVSRQGDDWGLDSAQHKVIDTYWDNIRELFSSLNALSMIGLSLSYSDAKKLWKMLHDFAYLYGYWSDREKWTSALIEKAHVQGDNIFCAELMAANGKIFLAREGMANADIACKTFEKALTLLRGTKVHDTNKDLYDHVSLSIILDLVAAKIQQREFPNVKEMSRKFLSLWRQTTSPELRRICNKNHIHSHLYIRYLFYRAEYFYLSNLPCRAERYYHLVDILSRKIKWARVIVKANQRIISLKIMSRDSRNPERAIETIRHWKKIAKQKGYKREFAFLLKDEALLSYRLGNYSDAKILAKSAISEFCALEMKIRVSEMNEFVNSLA